MKQERITLHNAATHLLTMLGVEPCEKLHTYVSRALAVEFLQHNSRYVINDMESPWFTVLLQGLAVVQENNHGVKATTRVINAGSLLSLPVKMSGWENKPVEVVPVLGICIGTINAMHYEVICGLFPAFETAVETMAERSVQEAANRAALLHLEPPQRYARFIEIFGKTALRIPDKLLAYYIGIEQKMLKTLREGFKK